MNWVISSLLPFVFISFFGYLFYQFLIDEFIIGDHFFLADFNTKMIWYAVPGYVATVACFGMFLLMSMAVDKLNTEADTQKIKIASNTELNDNYKALKKTFDASFLMTAFILSFFSVARAPIQCH